MQTTIKRPALMTLLVTSLSLAFFSFSSLKGGDSFEIRINNKVVIQQFLHGDRTVKSLVLNESNYKDDLSVSYSHCGKSGKSRSITLIDGQDRVLKVLRFPDAAKNSMMSFKVKEVLDLQKLKGNISLRLLYTSAELPAGHLLAAIPKNSPVARR